MKNREVILKEKETIEIMIRYFCNHKHETKNEDDLCDECRVLMLYAFKRLDKCRFKELKPTCRKCPVHCYGNDNREKIKEVMKYSGPRMIIINPLMAIKHLYKED